MTNKFDNFVEELKALCIKHKVTMDFGYEGGIVYDLDNSRPGWSDYPFWQDIGPGDGTEEE